MSDPRRQNAKHRYFGQLLGRPGDVAGLSADLARGDPGHRQSGASARDQRQQGLPRAKARRHRQQAKAERQNARREQSAGQGAGGGEGCALPPRRLKQGKRQETRRARRGGGR